METYVYEPIGVCANLIRVQIENDTIIDVSFNGGCNGNLKGISALVRGCKINEVIEKLKGIPCGVKSTSCPDQLSRCLMAYLKEKENLKQTV